MLRLQEIDLVFSYFLILFYFILFYFQFNFHIFLFIDLRVRISHVTQEKNVKGSRRSNIIC